MPGVFKWTITCRGRVILDVIGHGMPNHTAYTRKQLQYFSDLMKGRAPVSWGAWWKVNEATLKDQLKRPEYLRLKFRKVQYAWEILELNGIHIEWGSAAKREFYYANLHESVLDENGRPLESFRRKSYSGACGEYLGGRTHEARQKLASMISKLKRRGTMEAKDELGEMAFDGEMMVHSDVDAGFGRLLLEAVVSYGYGYGDDLTDFAVERAESLLQESQDT